MDGVCYCKAYGFPHRPGGGRCVGPDVVRKAIETHELYIDLDDVAYYSGCVSVLDVESIMAELELDLDLAPLV